MSKNPEKKYNRSERILSLLTKLSKSKMQVKDLADFYGVNAGRIYEDLKILERWVNLKKTKSFYWIEHPPQKSVYQLK